MSDQEWKRFFDKKTASVVQSRLVDGESVMAVSVIHDGIYWKSLAIFLLALVFALFVAVQLGIILAIAGGVALAYAHARKKVLLVVLTNRRILARYGLLQMDVVDIRFDKIESFESEQMLPGMLMGYANLVVMGTGNRYIAIPFVANAAAIRNKFDEMVLEES